MSNINQIGHRLALGSTDETYVDSTDREKSLVLSELLTTICEAAEKVEVICGNLTVDIDYLLGIEGSYLIGIKDGELTKDTPPPAELYETSLFPSLEAASGIEVQVIEEEEDIGEHTTNTVDEGHATEDTPDIRA